jgi:hypothetical protein
MRPQFLEEGFEIWILGANFPFSLKIFNNETIQLVAEAFVFGAMHGEAVKSVTGNYFHEVRLICTFR